MIRDRLRRLFNRRLAEPAGTVWASEPTGGWGSVTLPSGTRLERSALASVEEVRQATARPGRLTLHHHWASWAPAVEVDIPILLELHLAWAQHVDFFGIGWELMSGGGDLEEAALEVDAFHRAFGLTWRTLIVRGTRTELREALNVRSEILPQTILRDREGKIAWMQEGGLDDTAAAEVEALVQQLTGVVERPRMGFN